MTCVGNDTLAKNTCLFIKSCMGSSKTTSVISPLINNSSSAILVTTRKIQTTIFSKTLNMKSYIGHIGSININNTSNAKFCIQLESLGKVILTTGKLDLLVLDEVISIL